MKNKSEILRTAIQDIVFLIASMLILLSVVSIITSCNPKSEDPKKLAEEHNDAKFNDSKQTDAQFMVEAAEINLEEIQLGQLAQNNSTSADIKAFGKLMEKDHSKTLKDMETLALKKQITLPSALTANGQEAYKKLAGKAGADFDKEYCDMMVNGHKDAIKKFEKASSDASDADIRTWATSMLPTLRTHLDNAINCQKNCENAKKNNSI